MKLKAKTEQKQVRWQETKPAPLVMDPKMTNKDMYFLQYYALIGSLMYLIGLFLPYYKSIDKFKLGIDVLFLGDLYLWMLIIVTIVCAVGIARKKNYFRWIIPNSIVCTFEILLRFIFIHSKFLFHYSILLLGIGYFLIHLGTLIIWFSLIIYWLCINFEKQQKKRKGIAGM